jgi:hypothetical protein
MSDPDFDVTTVSFGEQEMVDGYLDGLDSDAPEPSENRSESYRHGFRSGRADCGRPRAESFDATRRAADRAIEKDDAK